MTCVSWSCFYLFIFSYHIFSIKSIYLSAKLCFLLFNVLDLLNSKHESMNNQSHIMLVSWRLIWHNRKAFVNWLQAWRQKLDKRVRCDESYKVSYFPGRLCVGDWKEQRQTMTAWDNQLASLSVGQIAWILVGQLALTERVSQILFRVLVGNFYPLTFCKP